MKVAGAFDKCIRRRIKRSFICDGSRGLILVQIYDFFEKCPDFCNFLGAKSEMMDEMGRDGFKFGIFDMGRCALISGPQKCWFWPIPGEPGGGRPGGTRGSHGVDPAH